MHDTLHYESLSILTYLSFFYSTRFFLLEQYDISQNLKHFSTTSEFVSSKMTFFSFVHYPPMLVHNALKTSSIIHKKIFGFSEVVDFTQLSLTTLIYFFKRPVNGYLIKLESKYIKHVVKQ